MSKKVISLSEQDVIELKTILMDNDGREVLNFLKINILAQILHNEKSHLDVEGKTHL